MHFNHKWIEVIKKSGNSYTYEEEKLGVGREKVKEYLKENKATFNKIEKEVLKAAKTI